MNSELVDEPQWVKFDGREGEWLIEGSTVKRVYRDVNGAITAIVEESRG